MRLASLLSLAGLASLLTMAVAQDEFCCTCEDCESCFSDCDVPGGCFIGVSTVPCPFITIIMGDGY